MAECGATAEIFNSEEIFHVFEPLLNLQERQLKYCGDKIIKLHPDLRFVAVQTPTRFAPSQSSNHSWGLVRSLLSRICEVQSRVEAAT